MKNIFFAIMSIALLSLTACSEEAGEGILTLKYAATVNSENLELNKTYVMDGDSVYFTLLQYYTSDIFIEDKDGTTETEIMDVSFIDFSEESSLEFSTTLEATAYKNPSYTVGLSDTRGAADPSSFGSDHPMSLNSSMFWIMSNSYIYFKIEGFRIKNGIEDPLVYHVGLTGYGENKQAQKAFSINDGNTTTLVTTLNLNEVFGNIDFDTEPETHQMNNMPLARKMMTNFANALSVN